MELDRLAYPHTHTRTQLERLLVVMPPSSYRSAEKDFFTGSPQSFVESLNENKYGNKPLCNFVSVARKMSSLFAIVEKSISLHFVSCWLLVLNARQNEIYFCRHCGEHVDCGALRFYWSPFSACFRLTTPYFSRTAKSRQPKTAFVESVCAQYMPKCRALALENYNTNLLNRFCVGADFVTCSRSLTYVIINQIFMCSVPCSVSVCAIAYSPLWVWVTVVGPKNASPIE